MTGLASLEHLDILLERGDTIQLRLDEAAYLKIVIKHILLVKEDGWSSQKNAPAKVCLCAISSIFLLLSNEETFLAN